MSPFAHFYLSHSSFNMPFCGWKNLMGTKSIADTKEHSDSTKNNICSISFIFSPSLSLSSRVYVKKFFLMSPNYVLHFFFALNSTNYSPFVCTMDGYVNVRKRFLKRLFLFSVDGTENITLFLRDRELVMEFYGFMMKFIFIREFIKFLLILVLLMKSWLVSPQKKIKKINFK